MLLRTASLSDLPALAAVEAECFPPAEAASAETLAGRLRVFPDHFWLLEDGGRIVSFIDGPVTDEPVIRDGLYEDPSLHDARGAWQAIFGVTTIAAYRGRGCAATVMARVIADARAQGRRGCILTCKAPLIPYYQRFGYVDEGRSGSAHGGAAWYDMRLTF